MDKNDAPDMPDPDFFSPDPHRLDEEWVRQPRLYYEYAARLVEARQDMELAKSRLEMITSDLDAAIRSNPEGYGLEKVTEPAIKNLIPTLPKYQKAQQSLIRAKHLVGLSEAAVTALDHRKKALEKLVDLHGMNYFSAPREPGSSNGTMKESREKHALGALARKKKAKDS